MPAARKRVFIALFSLYFFISPLVSSAALLTEPQVLSIVSLLRSFGVNQATLESVGAILRGSFPTPAPSPSLPSVSGTFSVTADASSPGYYLAAGGTNDNILGVVRVSASGEAVELKQIAFQLGGDVRPESLTRLTLWDGTEKVGSAVFAQATTTRAVFDALFVVPEDSFKTLAMKGDFAPTGFAQAGTSGGLISVNYDNDDMEGTQGVGKSSGAAIMRTPTSDTNFAGARAFTTFPAVASLPLPSAALGNTFMPLLRFKVSADSHGAVSIAQFSFEVVRAKASLSNFDVYCFADQNFTLPCSGLSADGGFTISDRSAAGEQTLFKIVPQVLSSANTVSRIPLVIPAGGAYYFQVAGNLLGVEPGASLSVRLLGDSAPQTLSDIAAASIHNFIWSPNSIRPASFNDRDWTNGYGVEGLDRGVSNSLALGSRPLRSLANVWSAVRGWFAR